MQFWYHSFSRIFYDASFFVCIFDFYRTVAGTAQKVKFSIKDSFSKCDQIRSFLRVWSYLLKKSLMENLIFCVVKHFFTCSDKYFFWPNKSGGFPIFLFSANLDFLSPIWFLKYSGGLNDDPTDLQLFWYFVLQYLALLLPSHMFCLPSLSLKL